METILKYFREIRFEEPERLALLFLVPALLVLILAGWGFKKSNRPPKTLGSRYPALGVFKLWLASTLGLAFIISAYAKPFVAEGGPKITKGLVEVIVIVDNSSSMFLKDAGWARIDIAAREALKLVSGKILDEGDRAALFLLGRIGVRRLPLTENLDDFTYALSRVGVPRTLKGDYIYWGSDIAKTLELVHRSLDRQDLYDEVGLEGLRRRDEALNEPAGKITKKSNRLAVLFSDGDFFGEDSDPSASQKLERLNRAIAEFRTRGIKVYTVGVGTLAGAPLIDILKDRRPIDHYEWGTEKDLEGIHSRLNPAYLTLISNATGGEGPFLIQNLEGDASSFLASAVEKHRGPGTAVSKTAEKTELWLWFLLTGLSLGLAGFLFTRF